jgi:hypothetical protein
VLAFEAGMRGRSCLTSRTALSVTLNPRWGGIDFSYWDVVALPVCVACGSLTNLMCPAAPSTPQVCALSIAQHCGSGDGSGESLGTALQRTCAVEI